MGIPQINAGPLVLDNGQNVAILVPIHVRARALNGNLALQVARAVKDANSMVQPWGQAGE